MQLVNDFFGYSAISIAYLMTALTILTIWRGPENLIIRKYVYVIAYVNFSEVVFLHIPYLKFIMDTDISPYDHEFQLSMLIIGLCLLIQATSLLYLKGVFYRVFCLGFLNVLSSLSLLRFAGAGIINTVWFFIFTGALCAFVLIIWQYTELSQVLDEIRVFNQGFEILEVVREELGRLLRLSVQGWLALAASLGVAMQEAPSR